MFKLSICTLYRARAGVVTGWQCECRTTATSTSYIDINSIHFHRFHHSVYYSDATIFLNKNVFHCHNIILLRLLHTNLTCVTHNKHTAYTFFCLPIEKLISHNGQKPFFSYWYAFPYKCSFSSFFPLSLSAMIFLRTFHW